MRAYRLSTSIGETTITIVMTPVDMNVKSFFGEPHTHIRCDVECVMGLSMQASSFVVVQAGGWGPFEARQLVESIFADMQRRKSIVQEEMKDDE
jgi:hypothetical protein